MRQPCVTAVTLIALFTATTAGAQSASAAKTASRDCADLLSTSFPDARIMSADAVAPNPDTIPVPHCKVLGVIGTEIRFQVLLPDSWNGRFLMGGNGGFAGSLDNDFSSRQAWLRVRGHRHGAPGLGHPGELGTGASGALHQLRTCRRPSRSPDGQGDRPRLLQPRSSVLVTSGAARTVAARR